MDSIWLPLATASILGQAPSVLHRDQCTNSIVLQARKNTCRWEMSR